MRISDVAKEVGVPISTIRFYEKQAVIPRPRRHGRNRSYSADDIRAIQFVRDAQSLGLPLREIAALIQNTWGEGEMAKAALGHRKAIRSQIEALERVDRVLQALETCTCKSFVECDLSACE